MITCQLPAGAGDFWPARLATRVSTYSAKQLFFSPAYLGQGAEEALVTRVTWTSGAQVGWHCVTRAIRVGTNGLTRVKRRVLGA